MELKNFIRQRLLEYAGVSDEVSEAARRLYNLIVQRQGEMEWEMIAEKWPDGKNVYWKVLNFNEKRDVVPFAQDIRIVLYRYDASAMDETDAIDELRFIIPSYGSYVENDCSVFISSPWPDNGTCSRKLEGSLEHELMHCWQSFNRMGTNYDTLRSKRDMDTRSRVYTSRDDFKYFVNNMVYCFDSDEMGAWIQGMWGEAREYGGLENTPSWKWMKRAIGNLDHVKTYASSSTLSEDDVQFIEGYIRSQFGMSLNRFIKIMTKKAEKMKASMMRLKYRWDVDNGNGGNGSFKDYASGEIRNKIPFKKPQNKWKRGLGNVMKWLKNNITVEEKTLNDMKANKVRLTESDIKEFVGRVAKRLIKEDVLGNNWHEADDDEVLNNYEPFESQLITGDNDHDWSTVGDDMDPTIYGESKKSINITESELLNIVSESVKRSIAKRLNESNELYDEWYEEEDYDGKTGEPGLIRSYDIGTYYTNQAEEDAEENGFNSLEEYLLHWFNEIKTDCPWYWTQKSGGNYKTLAQEDGVVIKELPGDQIVVDEYPIADAERDRAFQNKLEQGEYWTK